MTVAPRERIAVLGSTDTHVAACTRVAPARGETVAGESFRTVADSRGAHQAVAAARSGGDATTLGAVGDDDFGPRLHAALDGARAAARLRAPAHRTATADITAAGDTVVGAPAVALGEGRPVAGALARATPACALSVRRPGASSSPPDRAAADRVAPSPP
ncbi:PfkB family carbohydrate kinase [Streptomyces sp. NPDC006012]|uniref:PfkB family carbohydrate kinase n=1 Tax=Streptomyces sp. NPDC006012 TaxID=3364739 RepID=UPI0036B12808